MHKSHNDFVPPLGLIFGSMVDGPLPPLGALWAPGDITSYHNYCTLLVSGG